MTRIPLLLLALLTLGCKDDGPIGDSGTPAGDDTAEVDADNDGFPASEDCDDADPNINPGQTEICDGNDNNCDGEVDEQVLTTYYADDDADGFGDNDSPTEACEVPEGYSVVGNDCDDDEPTVYPSAPELCDDLDNNCDGEIDEAVEAVWYADGDEDGWGDPAVSVVACEPPEGFIEDNSDCDDGDPAIHPDAQEICDGEDNDCDGLIDDEDSSLDASTGDTFYADADGDGAGDAAATIRACATPDGYVDAADDCDDSDAAVLPGATEVCNSIDDDCDGLVDDDDNNLDASTGITLYRDRDGDSYGEASTTTMACAAASGYVTDDSDCDDSDANINPGATEVCNGDDDDCDGLVDDDDTSLDTSTASTWYIDQDGDGEGSSASSQLTCDAPNGYTSNADDCDDGDSAINTGATEVCDNADNDCDGLVDDDDTSLNTSTATRWYDDADGDGYGDSSTQQRTCDAPSGTVSDSTDCDDTDASINPAATEICDSVDNDCDSLIDDRDTSLDLSTASDWYADADGDNYGDASSSTTTCDQPSGYVGLSSDCDDSDANINPGATEVCDNADNDCDGLIDDDDSSLAASSTTTFYADDDSDGYGDSGDTQRACDRPSGYVTNSTDCDDGDAGANPGEQEVCSGIDDDCDGLIDDADTSLDTSTATVWYDDSDSDGYGDPTSTDLSCDPANGYVSDDTDCDDTDSSINPAASELCFDGVDNDCDLTVDENCSTCGDGVVDTGEEYDPAPGPFSTSTVDSSTCRWDFSSVRQLYCNGSCTWTGSSGCQQSEADLLCQLILDDANAYATSWTATTALSEHGFSCPRTRYGTVVNTDRGFTGTVYYTDDNIRSTHGAGSVVAYPVCAQ